MSYKIKITPAALRDLQSGIDYYNSKTRGLGRRFQSIVEDAFRRIEQLPQSASFAYDTVRYKPVDTFPYIILYEELEGNVISILRVFNTYLNPDTI